MSNRLLQVALAFASLLVVLPGSAVAQQDPAAPPAATPSPPPPQPMTPPPVDPGDQPRVEVPGGVAGAALVPDGTGEFGLVRGEYQLNLTGLVQIQAAPYVGGDSLVENGDPATTEGFRARRVRFGAYGKLPKHFGYRVYFELFDDVSASTTDGRPIGARLRDALIQYDQFKFATLIAGAGKVAHSRGSLASSAESAVIEDPFTVSRLGFDRRVGAALSGDVGLVNYAFGVYNADPSLSFGNRASGLLTAGRVELQTARIGYGQSTLGPGSKAPGGFAVGSAGSMHRDGAVEGWTGGGDFAFRHQFIVATGELLFSHTAPIARPATPPGSSTEVNSLGAYLTLAVAIMPRTLEAAARIEYFDGNTKIEDENDLLMIAGGVNAAILEGNAKAGLQYQRRGERHGRSLSNDAVLMQVQASF
jgi:hypothetical protein